MAVAVGSVVVVGLRVGSGAGIAVAARVGWGVGVASLPQAATRTARRERNTPGVASLTRPAVRVTTLRFFNYSPTFVQVVKLATITTPPRVLRWNRWLVHGKSN